MPGVAYRMRPVPSGTRISYPEARAVFGRGRLRAVGPSTGTVFLASAIISCKNARGARSMTAPRTPIAIEETRMSHAADVQGRRLEAFREYLRLLARLQLDPVLRGTGDLARVVSLVSFHSRCPLSAHETGSLRFRLATRSVESHWLGPFDRGRRSPPAGRLSHGRNTGENGLKSLANPPGSHGADVLREHSSGS